MKRFQVAHITFEIDEKENTFALIAGEAENASQRKPLFSGVITDMMGTEMRVLGSELEEIILRSKE